MDAQICGRHFGGLVHLNVILFQRKETMYYGKSNCSETFGKTDEQE